jgi:ribosomal protein L6P/L9E|uniref:50S ribosomal protein L6 n=1 Tax=Cyanidiaceae sp. MX-AZ01 TaxID=1503164 RepID=A0A060ADZ8_9RHOD|nr:50S ribosomal protein L6 [Cyanidiaceae sp. MX-AZ01]
MNINYYFLGCWQFFCWRFDKAFLKNTLIINTNKSNYFFFPLDCVKKKGVILLRKPINFISSDTSHSSVIHVLKDCKKNHVYLSFLDKSIKNRFQQILEDIFYGYHVILYLKGIGSKIEYSNDKKHLLLKLEQNNLLKLPLKYEDYELILLDAQTLLISGTSKEKICSIAAKIKRLKLPDPYKGKGIRYFLEHIYKMKKMQK